MSLPNGEPAFEVQMAKQVAEQLKQLIKASPRDDEVIASLKRITDRLERDPWNFGEQRYHLYDLRLQIRIAVVSPVAVIYGISMDRPTVYIKGFITLAGA
jgi:hypothetical protein